MSLEGLRAWIGEVERKLGKRTRVFLALAVIAVGLGGAAIYLAIDAREGSVSEGDVQVLQEELEAQIDEAATGSPPAAAEPVEPNQPEAEPEAEPAPEPKPKSGSGKESGAGGVGASGTGDLGTGGSSDTADSEAPDNVDSAKLRELVERTKEQNAEAEADQAGK